MVIRNGNNKGVYAIVGDDGRLLVDAVQRSEHLDAADDQRAFYYSTGLISFNTGFSAIAWLKNLNESNLHIYSIRSCNLNADAQWQFTKNPTAGTIVSGASLGESENSDFGSPSTPESTFYKGADGNTITDGTVFATHINGPGHSEMIAGGVIKLRQNNSFGIEVNPDTASTICCVTVLGYFEQDQG